MEWRTLMSTGSGVDEVKAVAAAAAAAMLAQRQFRWKKRNAYYNLLSSESRARDWDLDAGNLLRRSFLEARGRSVVFA